MEMLKEMKDKPSISPNSQKIIKKKKNYKSPMQRVKSYKEDLTCTKTLDKFYKVISDLQPIW